MATKLIKGKVLSNGEALPGANVFISNEKGEIKIPTAGTVTKFDGAFQLNVTENDKYITASYVGYQSQTIDLSKVNDPNNVEFNLVEGIMGEEFTVIGKKPINKIWIVIALLALLLIIGFFATKYIK